MSLFSGNPYPGRGLGIGLSDSGREVIVVYWLMGRSPSSRARRLTADGDRIVVKPTGAPDTTHPELIYYTAFARAGRSFVVSNGDQTDTIVEGLTSGAQFRDALGTRMHESDAPHYTSRISGLIEMVTVGPLFHLSRLRAVPGDPEHSWQDNFEFDDCPPGYGFALHTYAGNGEPLPAALGDPLVIPLHGSLEAVADAIWSEIEGPFRVALVAVSIDRTTLAIEHSFRRASG
jgi:IMP cyclohydrolase